MAKPELQVKVDLCFEVQTCPALRPGLYDNRAVVSTKGEMSAKARHTVIIQWTCSFQQYWGGLGGFPSGKESTCWCRRHKRHQFDLYVGKIPWRRAWQPTPVFLPGESHGQRTWWAKVHGVAKSWTWLKWLSMHPRGGLTPPYVWKWDLPLFFFDIFHDFYPLSN